MNESKTILIIILVAILLLYVTGITYIIVKYILPSNKNQNQSMNNNNNNALSPMPISQQTSCEINSSRTEFFKESVKKAEEVLTGKVFIDGYKYGAPVDLTKLDDSMKASIIVSMRYMMIDPISSRNIEEKFRLIVEQENVPLWFVILHEAIKKLIPIEHNPSVTEISNEALLAEIERRKLNQPSQNNLEGATIIPITRVA